jgi:hypothetical protein
MIIKSKNYNLQVELHQGESNYTNDFFKKYIKNYDARKNYSIESFAVNWQNEGYRNEPVIKIFNKGAFEIWNDPSRGITM